MGCATLEVTTVRGDAVEIALSKEIQAGLEAARTESLRKASRLRVEVDGTYHRVLRFWSTGFSLKAENAPQLRGLVDLYDGSIHLFQCLVIAVDEEDGEMLFEFKRATKVSNKAALDFEKSGGAPAGLITSNAFS